MNIYSRHKSESGSRWLESCREEGRARMPGQKPQHGQVCTKPVLLGGLAAAAFVFKELLPAERDTARPP